MKRLATCWLLVLLILSGCDAIDSITGPDEGPAMLSGRVTQASSGAPYYPATVSLYDATLDYEYKKVDTDGRYRFRSLEPGQYTVVLTLGDRGQTRVAVHEPIEIKLGTNVRDFVVP